MGEKNGSISSSVEFDTSSYKAGLSELNRQMRVLESGFRATAATMDDWSKTATGLETRNKTLVQSIDLQKQKIEGLNKVYQELASDGKTSSKELQEMEIKINRETESLGKMETELSKNSQALSEMGDGGQEAGLKVKKLGDEQDNAASKTEKFKAAMAGIGTAIKGLGIAVAGVATAMAGMGAAIGKLVFGAAESADELSELSLKTGISITRLQELSYISKQVGVDTETITGSMAKLTRSMNGARDGTGDVAKAFETLGVPITDANGNLRDSQTVFAESLTALGKMTNETERDAMSMTLFGKSAMELNPLIKTGAAEMGRLTDQAHEMGAVMSEENVAALGDFQDTLDGLKSGMKGQAGTVASAFLPAFKWVSGKATGYMKDLAKVVSGSGGDLGQMAGGVGKLVGRIANDIAGQGPEFLTAGLGILQGIITAIVSNLPTLLPAVISMIMTLVNFIVQNLPMLITAAVQIIVALATGIAGALPALIPAIVGIIPQIITILIDNLPLLIQAALQIIVALVMGLMIALPKLIESVPQILTSLVNAIIAAAPMLATAAVELVAALYAGIVNLGKKILEPAGAWFKTTIVDSITAQLGKLRDVGVNVVNSVWGGIQGQYNSFYNKVYGFFKSIVDAVKDVLDINSPSKVMDWAGEMTGKGFGDGLFRSLTEVREKIQSSFGPLLSDGAFPMMAGASGSGSGNSAYTFYAPVVIQGAAGQGIGEMIKAKRF